MRRQSVGNAARLDGRQFFVILQSSVKQLGVKQDGRIAHFLFVSPIWHGSAGFTR